MLFKTKATTAGASSTQAQPSVSAAPAQNPVAPVPAAAAAQLPSQAPATTTPAIGTGATPAIGTGTTQTDADAYGQAASNLVAGNNLEHVIQQILDMSGGSWDRDTVVCALRAAYKNPERAVEYLYSGIPETAEVAPPVTCPTPSIGQAANFTAPAPAAAAAAGSATAQGRILRRDEILTLPVQEPSTIEFSSSDLRWFEVEGWRQNVDKIALIPFSRVEDFVKGECSRTHDPPTRFRAKARKNEKVDFFYEYVLYWCCYGPDDRREGGTCRGSRKCIKPSEKKRPGRRHTLRGCSCHFIVTRPYAQPSVAIITYNQQKHVDKSGSPCHRHCDGTPKERRLWITSMLYMGFSVESIKQKHIERHGGRSNCDDFVFENYVLELKRDMLVTWGRRNTRSKCKVEHKKVD